jgi:hypothetical protein
MGASSSNQLKKKYLDKTERSCPEFNLSSSNICLFFGKQIKASHHLKA